MTCMYVHHAASIFCVRFELLLAQRWLIAARAVDHFEVSHLLRHHVVVTTLAASRRPVDVSRCNRMVVCKLRHLACHPT